MKLNDKELSKIVGGNRWGDTVLSAASGAGTGIKACKSFGPWGMAILAAFMANKEENESLDAYLNRKVFAGQQGTVMQPDAEDVKGFDAYIESYKAAIAAEKASVAALPLN